MSDNKLITYGETTNLINKFLGAGTENIDENAIPNNAYYGYNLPVGIHPTPILNLQMDSSKNYTRETDIALINSSTRGKIKIIGTSESNVIQTIVPNASYYYKILNPLNSSGADLLYNGYAIVKPSDFMQPYATTSGKGYAYVNIAQGVPSSIMIPVARFFNRMYYIKVGLNTQIIKYGNANSYYPPIVYTRYKEGLNYNISTAEGCFNICDGVCSYISGPYDTTSIKAKIDFFFNDSTLCTSTIKDNTSEILIKRIFNPSSYTSYGYIEKSEEGNILGSNEEISTVSAQPKYIHHFFEEVEKAVLDENGEEVLDVSTGLPKTEIEIVEKVEKIY